MVYLKHLITKLYFSATPRNCMTINRFNILLHFGCSAQTVIHGLHNLTEGTGLAYRCTLYTRWLPILGWVSNSLCKCVPDLLSHILMRLCQLQHVWTWLGQNANGTPPSLRKDTSAGSNDGHILGENFRNWIVDVKLVLDKWGAQ